MDKPDLYLAILLILFDRPQHEANDGTLQRQLDRRGIRLARTDIRAAMAWLRDAGAVSHRRVGADVVITLDEPGIEHVEDRASIDGIRRPRPGEVINT